MNIKDSLLKRSFRECGDFYIKIEDGGIGTCITIKVKVVNNNTIMVEFIFEDCGLNRGMVDTVIINNENDLTDALLC